MVDPCDNWIYLNWIKLSSFNIHLVTCNSSCYPATIAKACDVEMCTLVSLTD